MDDKISRNHLLEEARAVIKLIDDVTALQDVHMHLLALMRLMNDQTERRIRVHEILRQLKEVVVVVGDSSVGKSSIINYLLRRDLLVEGPGHCTPSCIHIEYSHDGQEYFRVGSSTARYELSQLETFSDKHERPGNEPLYVSLASDQDNLEQSILKIVDTPGMRSEDFDDSNELIDEADAFVLVVDVVSGFDKTRVEKFLSKRLTMWKPNVIIAFNHFDRLIDSPNRREKVIRNYLQQAKDLLKDSRSGAENVDDSIYFISSVQARSGHPQYTEDFESFRRKVLSDASNRHSQAQLDSIVGRIVSVAQGVEADVATLLTALEENLQKVRDWGRVCSEVDGEMDKILFKKENMNRNLIIAKKFFDQVYEDDCSAEPPSGNRFQLLINEDDSTAPLEEDSHPKKDVPKKEDHMTRTLNDFIRFLWQHQDQCLLPILPFEFDNGAFKQVERQIYREIVSARETLAEDYSSFDRHVKSDKKIKKKVKAAVGGLAGFAALGIGVGAGVTAIVEVEAIAFGAAIGGPIGVGVGLVGGAIALGSKALYEHLTRISRFQKKLAHILGVWQMVMRQHVCDGIAEKCDETGREIEQTMESLRNIKATYETRMAGLNLRQRHIGNVGNIII